MNSLNTRTLASFVAAAAWTAAACAPVVLSPDADDPGTTWVADADGGRVKKVNSSCSAVVATSPDLGRPVAVVFDSYRGYGWAADADGGRLFRLTSRAVVEKTLYGFGEPVALAFSPKENSVWVADRAQGKIFKVSERGTIRAELGGLNQPAAVAVNAVTGDVFVACANSIVRCDRWAQRLGTFYGYKNPQALVFDNGYGYLWVADTDNGRVVRLKTSGEVTAESKELAAPAALAVNPETGFCFAADANAGEIVSLKGDGTLRWSNHDYKRPAALAANPSDMSLWVADTYDFVVAKLKGSTGEAGTYESVAGFAYPAALYSDPGVR